MILFKENTASALSKHILDQYVDSILIASYGLAIQVGVVTIHCNERVFSSIAGISYEWDDTPSEIPWGLVVQQKTVGVELINPNTLCLSFESGDHLAIETVECEYESVVIKYPLQGDSLVMDIY